LPTPNTPQEENKDMKKLLVPAIISAAALTFAACGSDDDASNGPADVAESASGPTQPGTSSATTVTVVETDQLGSVLADAEGRVLYTSDEEAADPDVLCTDSCEEFWEPLATGSEPPTGAAGITGLDVTDRPDGTMQVTLDGRRLYTFTLDSSGEATGDGLSDEFGGQTFTWHAVVVDQASPGGTAVPEQSPGAATTPDDVEDYPGY
jgi:predicted lipoprotein with Yx(FWY)xxD motif